jgi:hypothetical protein
MCPILNVNNLSLTSDPVPFLGFFLKHYILTDCVFKQEEHNSKDPLDAAGLLVDIQKWIQMWT